MLVGRFVDAGKKIKVELSFFCLIIQFTTKQKSTSKILKSFIAFDDWLQVENLIREYLSISEGHAEGLRMISLFQEGGGGDAAGPAEGQPDHQRDQAQHNYNIQSHLYCMSKKP